MGGLATIHLPDYRITTLQLLIEFVTVGEIVVESLMLLEFMMLLSLLKIENITEQVIASLYLSSLYYNQVKQISHQMEVSTVPIDSEVVYILYDLSKVF